MSGQSLKLLIAGFAALCFSLNLCNAQSGKGGKRGMCGPPPPQKKQRFSGGEGSPPPGGASKLPCAPTRRTEKKMPPSPSTLVAKLSYGDNQDWTTDRNDIFNLLKLVGRQYDTSFRAVVVNFEGYEFNAKETPVVYMSGHNSFKMNAVQRRRLRSFIEEGGTLIIDSCCGYTEFADAAKAEIKKMFPDRRFKRLPLDHPVFSSHYQVKHVIYTPKVTDRPNREPYLEGVDFGCRTAVFFTPYDLSCGWDNHTHPHCKGVIDTDAIKLGVNMLSYALVNRKQGENLAEAKAYTDADKQTRGKVVLAQVKYAGEWNRHPAATANLLSDLDRNFPADVKYDRTDITLSDPAIFSHPVLYITGQDDFQLTSTEVANLRKYLEGGGTLLAESCCGRQDFDAAFRREIARVLPNAPLRQLPSSHPIFNIGYDLSNAGMPPQLKARHSNQDFPLIEGIDVNGATAVIYSRYALGCGWEMEDCKYCLGYDSQTAIHLGVNILGYALSH